MSARTEARQRVPALLEMVSQELRQAGACLPENREFIALDAANRGGGVPDELTIRIGQTDPDTLVCIRVGTTVNAGDGTAQLTFVAGDGDLFKGVALVYITPDGANRGLYPVVGNTSTIISLGDTLEGDHPIGTGVYTASCESTRYGFSYGPGPCGATQRPGVRLRHDGMHGYGPAWRRVARTSKF